MKRIHLVEKYSTRYSRRGPEHDYYSARYEFSKGMDIYQKLDFFAPHAERMEIIFENGEIGWPDETYPVTSETVDSILKENKGNNAKPDRHRFEIYLDNGVKVCMNQEGYTNINARSKGSDVAWKLEEYLNDKFPLYDLFRIGCIQLLLYECGSYFILSD